MLIWSALCYAPPLGTRMLLVPAIEPDIALIHAQYGDVRGNLLIQGPPVADILFAKASRAVLATVEELVPTERLELCGVQIPYFYGPR
jgi:glutaconate CoA-transferase, subunit A